MNTEPSAGDVWFADLGMTVCREYPRTCKLRSSSINEKTWAARCSSNGRDQKRDSRSLGLVIAAQTLSSRLLLEVIEQKGHVACTAPKQIKMPDKRWPHHRSAICNRRSPIRIHSRSISSYRISCLKFSASSPPLGDLCTLAVKHSSKNRRCGAASPYRFEEMGKMPSTP